MQGTVVSTLLAGLLATAGLSGQSGTANLSNALLFHAPFDGSGKAAFAKGDAEIYSAPSYKEQAAAKPGLSAPGVAIAAGEGKFGGALHFKQKNDAAVFFNARNNVPYANGQTSGTVSFWLKVDPETELAPGYTDPLQITDKAYNDSAIWVDFTKDDKPRHFRLGVFGALAKWNPGNVPPDSNQAFLSRLVVARRTPFSGREWTHVAITWTALGSGQGRAILYLDGLTAGETSTVTEPFVWEIGKTTFRLGVNFVGRMDDFAVFNRPLTGAEVKALYQLPRGVASLRR